MRHAHPLTPDPTGGPGDDPEGPRRSFRRILRSTTIIGGASVLNVLLSIVRTKVLAVFLGPSGMGLYGMYNAIMGAATGLAGLGLNQSGVRQIAEAQSRGGWPAVADTWAALWRGTAVLGVFGAAAMVLLRDPIARWTFGTSDHATAIAALGLGVLASLVAGSQTALLNGLRRIGDLARVTVYGSVGATAMTIAVVWLLKERGLLPVVVGITFVTMAVSTYFIARVPRPETRPTGRGERRQLWELIRLGIVLMLSGLLSSGSLLVARSLVVQRLGMDANGYFQAAWGITMTYLGFVLGAMGTDFFPRLSAAIHDRGAANRMVNDQAEVAILIAGPIVLGMLSFAPSIVSLLYSSRFDPAIPVFRWQLFGNLFKVMSWPLGFILLARGASFHYFATELIWNGVFLGAVWLGLDRYGLSVTGAGFLLAYVVYFIAVWVIARRLNAFAYRPRVLAVFGLALLLTGSTVAVRAWLPVAGPLIGIVCTASFGFYSLLTLSKTAGPDWVRTLLDRLPSWPTARVSKR